jgi:Uma2 family endonuclease
MIATRTNRSSTNGSAALPPFPVLKFTVTDYHRIAQAGILRSGDPYELLGGWIVPKMRLNPPHNKAVRLLNRRLGRLLDDDWVLQIQGAITLLPESEPEPDVVIAFGPEEKYIGNPQAKDIALVVEVADSSLDKDHVSKLAIYARARIPVYWIVNLIDRKVEVYTLPRGGRNPLYRQCLEFGPKDILPLILDGKQVGEILVKEILP